MCRALCFVVFYGSQSYSHLWTHFLSDPLVFAVSSSRFCCSYGNFIELCRSVGSVFLDVHSLPLLFSLVSIGSAIDVARRAASLDRVVATLDRVAETLDRVAATLDRTEPSLSVGLI